MYRSSWNLLIHLRIHSCPSRNIFYQTDQHGLLIHLRIHRCPLRNIYYQTDQHGLSPAHALRPSIKMSHNMRSTINKIIKGNKTIMINHIGRFSNLHFLLLHKFFFCDSMQVCDVFIHRDPQSQQSSLQSMCDCAVCYYYLCGDMHYTCMLVYIM